MLDNYRNKIDDIDNQLVKLMEERLLIVKDIGDYKKVEQIAIEDTSREDKVIERAKSRVYNDELLPYIETFMKDIISISKDMQRDYLHKE